MSVPSLELGPSPRPPTPLPPTSLYCVPLPEPREGRIRSPAAAGEGAGESQFGRQAKKPCTLSTLWYLYLLAKHLEGRNNRIGDQDLSLVHHHLRRLDHRRRVDDLQDLNALQSLLWTAVRRRRCRRSAQARRVTTSRVCCGNIVR